MAASDVIMLIDVLLKGGQTIEYATRQARIVYDEESVAEALEELDQRRRAIRELRDPLVVSDRSVIQPWYVGPLEGHIFWPALSEALLRGGLPQRALEESVDPSSSKILSYMKPPGEPRIDSRGLVVGHVQSGKTTNFTAVIAKAADAGYRLFVVLSGITDSLRLQTQERIDRDLIGPREQNWFKLTHESDFTDPGNVNTFLTDSNRRTIAVVKKNPARLRRLLRWLSQASDDTLRSCPILVVDDEADLASIDVGRARRSTINQRILDLLDQPKAAYIAYTATPFANLLIDPDAGNLYPKDFIVDLPKPEGHFGTETLFGRQPVTEEDDAEDLDGLDVVRHIPADEIALLRPPNDRDGRRDWSPEIPGSLREALLYFLLATAARLARGQDDHSSMLIHTTVFIEPQNSMREPVRRTLNEIAEGIANGRALSELRSLWESEQARFPPIEVARDPVPFDLVAQNLPSVCRRVEVVVDNSQSEERLHYGSEPRVVVAIGGNTLSRGLTLEGLVVSYFLRAASAYDTLLQMGRWFGYRPNYEDLPRIWMTADLHEWFMHLATVEAEIRTDIARYEAEQRTPRQLAVRIRTHPAMAVTARAKMRTAATVRISYSGERLQTFMFNHRDSGEIENNIAAVRNLIATARERGINAEQRPGRHSGWWLLRNVTNEEIVRFVGQYRFHENHADLKSQPISNYIRAQAQRGNLRAWNVVVAGRGSGAREVVELGPGLRVGLITRSRLNIPGIPHANIKALMSRVDRVADLPELDEEAARLNDEQLQARRPTDVGLLLIYPIDEISTPVRAGGKPSGGQPPRVALDAAGPVMGVGMVFPSVDDDLTPQSYMVAFERPRDLEDEEEAVEAALEELDERDEISASGIEDGK